MGTIVQIKACYFVEMPCDSRTNWKKKVFFLKMLFNILLWRIDSEGVSDLLFITLELHLCSDCYPVGALYLPVLPLSDVPFV